MPDSLAGIFRDDIPVIIRITDTATRTALAIADVDIPLRKVTLRDGLILAEHVDGSGNVTKYLLSPHVCYLRQVQPVTPAPPAPSGG